MLGPNIIGGFTAYWYNTPVGANGTFTKRVDNMGLSGTSSAESNCKDTYFSFSASLSNSTYGSSSTVQPKAINLNVLIKF
jgi:hypothetical protein